MYNCATCDKVLTRDEKIVSNSVCEECLTKSREYRTAFTETLLKITKLDEANIGIKTARIIARGLEHHGMVVVPKVPTVEMVERAADLPATNDWDQHINDVYQTMLGEYKNPKKE